VTDRRESGAIVRLRETVNEILTMLNGIPLARV
jgi:hypothetical protein